MRQLVLPMVHAQIAAPPFFCMRDPNIIFFLIHYAQTTKIHSLSAFVFLPLQTVSADGCSLVDLLDTYMKNCTDRTIKPFGGQLFLQYDEPWNPPRKCYDMPVCYQFGNRNRAPNLYFEKWPIITNSIITSIIVLKGTPIFAATYYETHVEV